MLSRRQVLQMASRDSWKFEVDLRIVGFEGVCAEVKMLCPGSKEKVMWFRRFD